MAKLHVPLDVDFATDAKILSAGHTAAYLYICSLAHCKRTAKPGEDGVIHREQLRVLAYGLPGRPDKLAEILVDVGLWKPHRRGWMIPAWLKHNPSSEQLAADKAMRRAKSIQGNHEQHHVAKDKKALDCVLCYPEGPPSPAGSPLGSPRGPGKDSYKRREGNSKGREGKGREGKGREGNKEDSSSSTLSLAATPPPEEEESTYDDALKILVRYRYTHRGTDQPPIVNLLAWEATTKANENATHGNEIRQLLTQGTDAASAVAGIIDPAEARRIARDLGLRVEFDERPLPDPDCGDCAGSGWRTIEEGSTRVEPCPCMASNVTPLRRTS